MKKITTVVLALVMALCLSVALTGCASTEYTPKKKQQTIDDSALKSAGTLRVGVDASSAPYAVASSGQIIGINVDIAAAIADELGLKLELVDVGTDAAKAFESENVDIVMGVQSENSVYWLSSSYMTSAIALFSTDESAVAPLTKGTATIAAQSSSMSAWEVDELYGEDALSSAPDLPTAFTALENGSVNFVAADSTIGAYVAHSSGLTVYPVALLQDPINYHIAASSTNVLLQSSITEALSTLQQDGTINLIMKKWMGDVTDISLLNVIKQVQ